MESFIAEVSNHCSIREIPLSERRKEVVLVLQSANGYLVAEDIYFQILTRNLVSVSMASVYKILNWLVNEGFAEKVQRNERNNYYRMRPQVRA